MNINDIFSTLKKKTAIWKIADDFAGAPFYYDDKGKSFPFLSELILTDLKLPAAIQDNNIRFSANMGKSIGFLKKLICYHDLPQTMAVECVITEEEYGDIIFQAGCKGIVSNPKISGIDITVTSFQFSSGFLPDTPALPSFIYEGSAKDTKNILNLTLYSLPGYEKFDISGNYTDKQGLSVDGILSVLGLGNIAFGDYSPIPTGYFDDLSLSQTYISINGETAESIELKVASKRSWAVTEQIAITPDFHIQILNPSDTSKRSVYFAVQGEARIGTTTYEAYADPFLGNITIGMKAGETLDFKAISTAFLNTELPSLKITDLTAALNFKTSEYAFCLSAADVWQFSMLNKNFNIEKVLLNIWYEKKRFTTALRGDFKFLGVYLAVVCEYAGKENFKISAFTTQPIKLTAFLQEFLDSSTITSYIPDSFTNLEISDLKLAYGKNTANANVSFDLQLKNVLTITDKFKIENFFLETRFTNGKPENIRLFSTFAALSSLFTLEITKNKEETTYCGSTAKNRNIPVGVLISDMLSGWFSYEVALPQSLSTFTIDNIGFTYVSGNTGVSFGFDCTAAFSGSDSILASVFSAKVHIVVTGEKTVNWAFGFKICCEVVLKAAQSITCEYVYGKSANVVSLTYAPKSQVDTVSFEEILKAIGVKNIDGSWAFLTDTGISKAGILYDFAKKELEASLIISDGSTLTVKLAFNADFEYSIVLLSKAVVSLTDIPVAGGLVEKFVPGEKDFSFSDISFYALSRRYAIGSVPAGVRLSFKALGKDTAIQIYGQKTMKAVTYRPQENAGAPQTFWINIDKTVAIFTLHRLGVSLDGGDMGLLLDASLSVNPLVFEMMGLGIYTSLKDFTKIKFKLSGIGISFENKSLAIAGSFMRTEGKSGVPDLYAGSLAITVGKLSVFAVGQYSDGSLMAYACVNVPLGGPPVFFVKGLAAGFGYNQNLLLPDIENVAAYPLILGAKGSISQADLPSKLAKYITPLSGQNFLAAGIRFTSFEIADSFLLATVSFGKKLQIGLLGLSDISMPPNCKTDPIAYAQLAIRAAISPDDGIFSVEARLTSESFVLSKNCKLTGGFAFYIWFGGNEHTGDFVITLGGYHPRYKKPAHYPDVPRLGFRWDLIPAKPNRLVISGEMYFALTPSAIMAGGRLSAVYSDGNLRAWFLARADFFLSWKPFHYDIEIDISIGASYKVDFLFVHTTFTIELGCGLHIWGPEFSGIARISWFIISFNISFGAGASQIPDTIDWAEFAESFLPKDKAVVNPLSASLTKGIIGKSDKDIPIVCAEDFELSFSSAIPVTSLSAGSSVSFVSGNAQPPYVKPMGKALNGSTLSLTLYYMENGAKRTTDVVTESVTQNVPAALWGAQDHKGELVENVLCGGTSRAIAKNAEFFPEHGYISEKMLSDINPIEKKDAFQFMEPWILPVYQTYETVTLVTETAGNLKTKGKDFLKTMGYSGACDITAFAVNADDYIDEDVFAGAIS